MHAPIVALHPFAQYDPNWETHALDAHTGADAYVELKHAPVHA